VQNNSAMLAPAPNVRVGGPASRSAVPEIVRIAASARPDISALERAAMSHRALSELINVSVTDTHRKSAVAEHVAARDIIHR
jgi:hypothetical protein